MERLEKEEIELLRNLERHLREIDLSEAVSGDDGRVLKKMGLSAEFREAERALDDLRAGIREAIGRKAEPTKWDFTVPSGREWIETIVAQEGDVISGTFAVRGGNNDVDFWVEDPLRRRVIDAGRVSGNYEFEIEVKEKGDYIFHFGNGFSSITSKEVSVVYKVM
jgi:hypothetical protein